MGFMGSGFGAINIGDEIIEINNQVVVGDASLDTSSPCIRSDRLGPAVFQRSHSFVAASQRNLPTREEDASTQRRRGLLQASGGDDAQSSTWHACTRRARTHQTANTGEPDDAARTRRVRAVDPSLIPVRPVSKRSIQEEEQVD